MWLRKIILILRKIAFTVLSHVYALTWTIKWKYFFTPTIKLFYFYFAVSIETDELEIIPLTPEKVLEIIEQAYPNPVAIDDLAR